MIYLGLRNQTDSVNLFFCSSEHRDEWYLRIRDPQSMHFNEQDSMRNWDLITEEGEGLNCVWCTKISEITTS